jgi:outer membrane protein OmpA-like peptidoglycan-associated protein
MKHAVKLLAPGVLLTAALAMAGGPDASAPTLHMPMTTAARAAALEDYNVIALKRVYFLVGHAGLRRSEVAALSEIARQLRQRTDLVVELRGYADGAPSPAGDVALSLDRAGAVARLLGKEGIAQERILVLGLGEVDPTGAARQAEHQRVDVRIFERPATAIPTRRETGTSSSIQDTWGGK